MNLGLFALWALVGICPDWWPGRKWPGPGPPPWWWAVGIIGGIIGGVIFDRVFGPARGEDVGAIYAAATSVGAFVGSTILQRVVGMFAGGRANVDVNRGGGPQL